MEEKEQRLLPDVWIVEEGIESMKKALQKWEKKIIPNEYKETFDNFKEKLASMTKSIVLITKFHSRSLEEPSEPHNISENAEIEEHSLVKENRDVDSRVQDLEAQDKQSQKEISKLKKTIEKFEKDIISMIVKITSQSEENEKLSQRVDEVEEKISIQNKDLIEKKMELSQADEDQDMIILGDFAYQFQTLLAKVLGEKNGLTIVQVEGVIERNPTSKGVELLRKVGLAEKNTLSKLDAALLAIKDARNLVGHKAIMKSMDFNFSEIQKLADKHYLGDKVSLIVEVWKKLMNSGKIFDANTWILNDPS